MSPIFNEKQYTFLKWLNLIALPAVAGFVLTVGPLVDLPNYKTIAAVIAAVATLIGLLIGVSSKQFYGGGADGVLEVNKNDPSVLHGLNLDNTEPKDLANKSTVVLRLDRVNAEIPPPEDVA